VQTCALPIWPAPRSWPARPVRPDGRGRRRRRRRPSWAALSPVPVVDTTSLIGGVGCPAMRVLRWFVVVLLVVALAAFGAGLWMVRRSFPVTEGTVSLAGLEAEVTVVRDESGVPHITASTAEDLF